jgi:hypothetical protein
MSVLSALSLSLIAKELVHISEARVIELTYNTEYAITQALAATYVVLYSPLFLTEVIRVIGR